MDRVILPIDPKKEFYHILYILSSDLLFLVEVLRPFLRTPRISICTYQVSRCNSSTWDRLAGNSNFRLMASIAFQSLSISFLTVSG